MTELRFLEMLRLLLTRGKRGEAEKAVDARLSELVMKERVFQ